MSGPNQPTWLYVRFAHSLAFSNHQVVFTELFYSNVHHENPIAAQVTTAMLGPKPKWTFCSGNTALPPVEGTKPQRQPVHSDADFAHPTHPFALVVNVPLITFTPENGATEIWLGPHTGTVHVPASWLKT